MRSILAGVAAFSVAACSLDPVGDCPPGSATVQQRGQSIVVNRCYRCHHSSLSGDERHAAPNSLNFDQLDVVREWQGEIYGETSVGAMPPGIETNDEDLEALRVWLACGAVEAP